ncbi:MAG TPA: CopG family antitoxin, partial [Gemmataceae bacterium]|nr:CopG family antitoxin [Gemmataceae bacterium]
MKKSQFPKLDSIQELAEFWDAHDLTDFEEELEEVPEPVFVRRYAVNVRLKPSEAKALRQMAQRKGVTAAELLHTWVLQ